MQLYRLKHVPSLVLVACFIHAVSPAAALAKKIDGDRLLDPEQVIDIRIELDDDDWEELRGQARNTGAFFSGAPMPDPFKWFKADLWINDKKIRKVAVRKKGFFGSLDTVRPSLKVKFDEYRKQDPVKGLDRLTLNNNKQDQSQISQMLTYQLFNRAGIQAPRCSFARVTVNGEFLGIYTHVESVRKPFLKRRFGDSSGNLYEGTVMDIHTRTVERLEAKTNKKKNDRTRLARLAKVLTADGQLKVDELEELMDVDEFMRHWALEGIIRFWDGYASNQNNYFIYDNPEDGRYHMIPWGADSSFTRGGPFGNFGGGNSTAVYAQGAIANRLYHVPGMPDRYRETLLGLLDEIWKVDELIAEIDRCEALLKDHLHERQQGMATAMETTREFIRTRPDTLREELKENWPAQVPSAPRRPMYTVPVGEAEGTFAATWFEDSGDEQNESDETNEPPEATLSLTLDDKPVSLKQIDVTVQTQRSRGFSGRGFDNSSPPVSIVFAGIRDDNERVRLSLTVDRKSFLGRSNPVLVTGRLTEGESSGFGFGGPRGHSVHGKLNLTESGDSAGDAVVGSVELKIVDVRGGFFDRRNDPPRPRVRLDFAKRMMSNDKNKDGKVTAEELPAFLKGMLTRGDTNKDGALDEAEAAALGKKLGIGASPGGDDKDEEKPTSEEAATLKEETDKAVSEESTPAEKKTDSTDQE